MNKGDTLNTVTYTVYKLIISYCVTNCTCGKDFFFLQKAKLNIRNRLAQRKVTEAKIPEECRQWIRVLFYVRV